MMALASSILPYFATPATGVDATDVEILSEDRAKNGGAQASDGRIDCRKLTDEDKSAFGMSTDDHMTAVRTAADDYMTSVEISIDSCSVAHDATAVEVESIF